MEQYEGIAILATNLRQNMDEAFIRRLQFAVEFPFPDAEDRRRIWEVLFPANAPRDPDIDFASLGRDYRIAGGNIKNAVLAAAFNAAAEGVPIGTDHVLRATRRELQKMGRVVGGPDPETERTDRR
jgi:SpoVK/Ycf46/Vps4 family AAA+-type ATPase